MKIQIEVEIPEYEWIEKTVTYSTPICNVDSYSKVRKVERFLSYVFGRDDIYDIIKINHEIRCMICKELISRNLEFLYDYSLEYAAIHLSNLLHEFKSPNGLKPTDYKFKCDKLNEGKVLKFKSFNETFNTEKEAFKHVTLVYLSSNDFKYEHLR